MYCDFFVIFFWSRQLRNLWVIVIGPVDFEMNTGSLSRLLFRSYYKYYLPFLIIIH